MRSVTVRLDDLRTTILCLGYVGENEHTRINIDAKKMYDQYPSASASLTVCPPEGESYPAVITRDGDMVIWDITDSDLVAEGSGEIQLSFTQGETVAKTFIGRFKVSRSLVPTGDIPSGLDDFLTRAGAALTAIPETIDEALAEAKASGEFDGEDGQDGQDGADGFSPIATVTKSGNKTTISITDANGTTTAEVTDGADGAPGQDGAPGIDGFSPRATVSKSGNTATITITDAAGTTTAQISDGESADIIDDTAGAGDTDKVWSADKSSALLTEIVNRPESKTSTATGVDLDVTDEDGNVLVRLKDGNLQTKHFDSSKSSSGAIQGTDNNADLYLTDESGNGLVRFFGGNIQTKNFNSDQSEYRKTFAYNDASGKQTIIRFFPKGTVLVFHLAKPENGSESIANTNVTYSYDDLNGTSHNLGKDSGYNFFRCVLPEDAGAVSVSYGSGMLWGFSGTLVFSVFSEPNYGRKPVVVTLGTNKDFASLRDAVEAVAPMASDYCPCEIHVYPGTYDVLDDFTADEIAVNDFVGLMITNGISLIGIGSRDEIIISAEMDTSTYDSTKRNKVSTLNIQGNVKLENLTVAAENIRYAVHDDFGSLSGKINNHVFINVKMYGTNLTTGDISFGAGGGNYKRVYAKDCDFTGTFLVHNSDSNVHSMKVYLENCSARMFSFPDYNALVSTNVYLRNCKAVFISVATINGPHDQFMFIDGEGTCGAFVYCPEGYIYNTGDCRRIDKEQISAGYAVKMTRRTYHASNSNIGVTTNLDDIYGISIGTDGSGTILQVSGYINSNTLGISGLAVGDYLTIDSNGAVGGGGTAANAIAKVILVDENGIAYAKLMF